jgi:hypothetical protein
MKDTIFLAVTLAFVMSMLPVLSITTTSVFNAAASSSSSPPAPAAKVHFDTDTTITDIVAIHNSGIPFDKYVAKISAEAKGQNATISQILAISLYLHLFYHLHPRQFVIQRCHLHMRYVKEIQLSQIVILVQLQNILQKL